MTVPYPGPSPYAYLKSLDTATVVATAGADAPRISRGWGPKLEGRTVTICVEAPPSSGVRETLVAEQAIAISVVRPSTYFALQVKGTICAVREPTPAQMDRAVRHREGLYVDGRSVGLGRQAALRLFESRSLLAVSFVMRELYDQTPGPGAGRRIDGAEPLGGQSSG